MISINTSKKLIQTIFPQPATNTLSIKFYSEINAVLNFSLTDINGKMVLSKNNFTVSNGIATLDVSTIDAGIYFIKVMTNNDLDVKKIIIQ